MKIIINCIRIEIKKKIEQNVVNFEVRKNERNNQQQLPDHNNVCTLGEEFGFVNDM